MVLKYNRIDLLMEFVFAMIYRQSELDLHLKR